MIYRLCIFIACLAVVSSCSEGDIIDISVDFNGTLENCTNPNSRTFVFYKIDPEENRVLFVNFTSSTFDNTPESADISLTEPTTIALNTSTNQFTYRVFSTPIEGDTYFCNSIPPSSASVTEELISTNGTIEISYTLISDKTYTRTVTLNDVTLSGSGLSVRREIFILGSDVVEVAD